MDEQNLKHELAVIKAQAQVELNKLHAQNSAKEVAGKAIGEDGTVFVNVFAERKT